jgi:glutamine synthetase
MAMPSVAPTVGGVARADPGGWLALDENHEFLLKDGVFTSDVLDVWLEYKRQHELDPVRLRPHPWEFYLYFDV